MGLRRRLALGGITVDAAGQSITVRVRGVRHPLELRARSSDLDVLMKVFADRECELLSRQKPRSILDGGANVGFAAVYYAELYPEATVVAVEPDRDNFAILQKNTAGYASIAVFEAAIWSSDTQVELEDPGMDQHAFRVADCHSNQTCRADQSRPCPSRHSPSGRMFQDLIW